MRNLTASSLKNLSDKRQSDVIAKFRNQHIDPDLIKAAGAGLHERTFIASFPEGVTYVALAEGLAADGFSVKFNQPSIYESNSHSTYTIYW